MPNINDYGLPFTSQDGDRKYSALEWREYFSRLIHNGLIQNAANECQVKPQAVPNKTVYVDTGVVFINGAMRVLDVPVTLAVAENTSGNPRIDRVVARLNEASRTIEFAVLEGTPAGSPVAPALTRTEGVYELGLADVTLANGYSTITATEIADQRWDVSLCGASSMTIGVIPPSGLEAETVTLSAETAELYKEGFVDAALMKAVPTASYMAFCTNANTNSLDAAFGKNNENTIKGLGLQLAMYSWFKGDSKTTYPFQVLKQCDTLMDILSNPNAMTEIVDNANLLALFVSSPYVSTILQAEDYSLPDKVLYFNGDVQTALTGGYVFSVTDMPTGSSSLNTNVSGQMRLIGSRAYNDSSADARATAITNNLITYGKLYKHLNFEFGDLTIAGIGLMRVGFDDSFTTINASNIASYANGNLKISDWTRINSGARKVRIQTSSNGTSSSVVTVNIKKIWLSTQ